MFCVFLTLAPFNFFSFVRHQRRIWNPPKDREFLYVNKKNMYVWKIWKTSPNSFSEKVRCGIFTAGIRLTPKWDFEERTCMNADLDADLNDCTTDAAWSLDMWTGSLVSAALDGAGMFSSAHSSRKQADVLAMLLDSKNWTKTRCVQSVDDNEWFTTNQARSKKVKYKKFLNSLLKTHLAF